MSTGTSLPGGLSGVNNNGVVANTGNTNTAQPRVTGTVEIEIVATSPGRTRSDLMFVDAIVNSPTQYQGYSLQEMYRLDPTCVRARGRMLALALATGIGRVGVFHARELVGRRMQVTADGHGCWHSERGPKPVIVEAPHLVAVADAAEKALMQDEGLFVRAGALVRTIRPAARLPETLKKLQITPAADVPLIGIVSAANLRERMATTARWQKTGKSGHVDTLPPRWVVETILARGEWPFRPLDRIVEAPTLRPDGSVLDTPGYDAATGILYVPAHEYPCVPQYPSRAEALAAAELLLDVMCDFPFVAASDRGAALAAMLTMAAGRAVGGPTPLHAYRAPAPGTGKGRLAEASTIAIIGRAPTLTVPVSEDEEWRKRLFALGLGGHGVVLIDNVKGTFGSASLSAALTTGEITDRVLGASHMMTVPLRPTWLLTGNNVSFVDDAARRVVPIDLDANVEHPEDRAVFKYPDLIEHVKQTHPILVTAALTILRAFCLAGRPGHRKPTMGSFEAWDALIRSAILWLQHDQFGDPLDGRARIRADSDLDVATISEVLHAWHGVFIGTAQTIADAIAKAKQDSVQASDAKRVALQDSALMTALRLADPNGREPRANVLGYKFRSWRGRIVDGLRLEKAGDPQGTAQWRVVRVAAPSPPRGGDGGHGGDGSSLGTFQSEVGGRTRVKGWDHDHHGNDPHGEVTS